MNVVQECARLEEDRYWWMGGDVGKCTGTGWSVLAAEECCKPVDADPDADAGGDALAGCLLAVDDEESSAGEVYY